MKYWLGLYDRMNRKSFIYSNNSEHISYHILVNIKLTPFCVTDIAFCSAILKILDWKQSYIEFQ